MNYKCRVCGKEMEIIQEERVHTHSLMKPGKLLGFVMYYRCKDCGIILVEVSTFNKDLEDFLAWEKKKTEI
jgi:DNA-directed RNA polymerase subunit RPC12/RpoP